MKSYTLPVLLALAISANAAQTVKNKAGGNTDAIVGDNKINYGDQPPWDAFDKIKEKCTALGCNSAVSINHKTGLIIDGLYTDATISMSVEGTFNEPGQAGNLNNMVEIAKSTIAYSNYNVKKGEPYHYSDTCQATGTPCDPPEIYHMDQYRASNLITVRAEDKDGSELADISISVDIETPDSGPGACDTTLTALSAIAGAISGIAGGIFTLGSLGCQ